MNRRPQTDFIHIESLLTPPKIDLRGDVRPNYPPTDPAAWPPGALDRLAADIVAADPDNLPEQWEPVPLSSPTTQAMALKAGQKHVDAIANGKLPTGPSRDLTPEEMASRYGLYADDNWPPLDSKIYDVFSQTPPAPPRAPERPLRAFPGVNGRVRIDADKTRFWTSDEPPKPTALGWGDEFDASSAAPDKPSAWKDRRVLLALVVAVAVVGAAVAVTIFSLPEYLPVLKANWPWR